MNKDGNFSPEVNEACGLVFTSLFYAARDPSPVSGTLWETMLRPYEA